MSDWPSLVAQLASGDLSVHGALVDWLEPESFRTQRLIEAALDGAGTPRQRALLAAHREDPRWARMVPMHLLEYPQILRGASHLEMSVHDAFLVAGWAGRHARALVEKKRAPEAAGALLDDLQGIARTCEDALLALSRMRSLVEPPLHLLRVQALERITRVLPDLRGVEVLEVGAEDGTLLRALHDRGARVTGLDIAPLPSSLPIVRGDLMHAALPGHYGLIVATAVFEHGSGWTLERGAVLLARLHAVLAPSGVVVLENIGIPLPFTDDDVTRAGFERIAQVIPSTNPVAGGRGCTLRRR